MKTLELSHRQSVTAKQNTDISRVHFVCYERNLCSYPDRQLVRLRRPTHEVGGYWRLHHLFE